MELRQLNVKPGHTSEFVEVARMILAGYKQVPGSHWTMFEQVYGTHSNAYIVLTPLKGLGEVDTELASDEAFTKVMGDVGMKKIETLLAACIETDETNLFRISPKMSLPPEEWIKAEPEFWRPKATTAKKAVAKPAQ